VFDRVERRPAISWLAKAWSIVLPADPGALQAVQDRLKFEARELLGNAPGTVLDGYGRGVVGIASPGSVGIFDGIADGSGGLRGYGVEMVGKLGPMSEENMRSANTNCLA